MSSSSCGIEYFQTSMHHISCTCAHKVNVILVMQELDNTQVKGIGRPFSMMRGHAYPNERHYASPIRCRQARKQDR